MKQNKQVELKKIRFLARSPRLDEAETRNVNGLIFNLFHLEMRSGFAIYKC